MGTGIGGGWSGEMESPTLDGIIIVIEMRVQRIWGATYQIYLSFMAVRTFNRLGDRRTLRRGTTCPKPVCCTTCIPNLHSVTDTSFSCCDGHSSFERYDGYSSFAWCDGTLIYCMVIRDDRRSSRGPYVMLDRRRTIVGIIMS